VISIKMSGDKQVLAALQEMVKRTGPPGRGRLLAALGQRVALRHMPATIRENRPGWAKPSSYYRGWRSGGQPLVDTGRLVNSWAWRANQNDVKIFTAVRYARQLDQGGVIRPRGRFLLIPQSPPLRMTEARGWPSGKAAIAARYPGSFFLFHGPEGPGIYRKSRTRTGNWKTGKQSYLGGTLGIERIAAARRQVTQKGYHFGRWRSEWMPDLVSVAQHFIISGQLPAAPSSGGNPDKGPRGGQVG
jgi:phage gpG-like protein